MHHATKKALAKRIKAGTLTLGSSVMIGDNYYYMMNAGGQVPPYILVSTRFNRYCVPVKDILQ